MQQKENQKKIIFPEGSVAIFALFLMFILTVTTISIITTATIARKVSISTGNSATAFQVAESGMETTLQYFKSNFDKKLSDIPSSPVCANGVLNPNSNNPIKFKNNNGAPAYIADCDELISNVKVIKSIGTTKQETRAIEEDVFLGATRLLLHMNGTSGGNFEDSSFYFDRHIVSTEDVNAETKSHADFSNNQSALFSGSGYLSVSDSNEWNFGVGDFTIDMWVNFNSLPISGQYMNLGSQYESANKRTSFSLYNNGGTYQWHVYANGGGLPILNFGVNADSISSDAWYHVAFVRKDNDLIIFQDGKQCGTAETISGSFPDLSADFNIGYQSSSNPDYLDGYIDEYRISKGIARWTLATAPFDTPTNEYWPD